MSSEIVRNDGLLAHAVASLGRDERVRGLIFEALREAELQAEDPSAFREQVRWPVILAMLSDVESHRVVLENGVIFDVRPDSRIEKALLLSSAAHPDHVWEPQTTRLLTTLARDATNVIVGGAYIGDQTVLIAHAMPAGKVHAFEPMSHAFERLLHHVQINDLHNVVPHRLGLWSTSNASLQLDGHLALASSIAIDDEQNTTGETTESLSIDDYVRSQDLSPVELIMLDTEGGEENALLGAQHTIARDQPHLIFEIHRNFVDWTAGLEKTSVVRFLTSQGYDMFAIRDFHNNYPMRAFPIEIVPVTSVYLEGPPHGFNLLATRDETLVKRLDLRIVENVSPKLLLEKDPALHFPKFTNDQE
ncbi:MAG TPA: FkbM family methyltransferase [Pyrinomonadaceae bacterium]|jgi:FkbM family methyltransferase|nr:FkbM family methyltransferase [Pyrinomonadaceae bacterium]